MLCEVSAGRPSVLLKLSAFELLRSCQRRFSYFLPASVAQQPQNRAAGQQTTAMHTPTTKPNVGPTTLTWHGFWSCVLLSATLYSSSAYLLLLTGAALDAYRKEANVAHGCGDGGWLGSGYAAVACSTKVDYGCLWRDVSYFRKKKVERLQ